LSIENRMNAVKSIYKTIYIVIQEIERRDTAKPLEAQTGLTQKENIRKILENAGPLEKAIILDGVSSGLSVMKICNLGIREFESGYDPEAEITTLKLRREKTDYDIITFLTPEASKAIKNYIAHRERTTRNGNKTTHNVELRKLGEETVQEMYRTLYEDTELCADKWVWNKVRSHKMRKCFSNRLRKAGCDPVLREFMRDINSRKYGKLL
jgi:integrase